MSRIYVPTLIVRERAAPPARLTARVRPHYIRYEVGRYRDRLRSGPGGLGRARVWTPERVGEQHNLLLDQAFDLIGAHGFGALTAYAVVGTGSAAPATTDTGLGAEVARSNSIPSGEADAITRVADGLWQVDRVREFTEAQVGGQNLAEWGWAPGGTGGAADLAVRELFRDGSNNPVVLSLAADQRLRLYYSQQVQFGPTTAQAASINIANIGTLNGSFVIVKGSDSSGKNDWEFFDRFVRGDADYSYPFYYMKFGLHTNALSTLYSDGTYGSAAAEQTLQYQAYTTGSRQRQTIQQLWGTSVVLTGITTLALGWDYGSNNIGSQWIVRFVLNTPFDKDNLHKLYIDPWTITW